MNKCVWRCTGAEIEAKEQDLVARILRLRKHLDEMRIGMQVRAQRPTPLVSVWAMESVEWIISREQERVWLSFAPHLHVCLLFFW